MPIEFLDEKDKKGTVEFLDEKDKKGTVEFLDEKDKKGTVEFLDEEPITPTPSTQFNFQKIREFLRKPAQIAGEIIPQLPSPIPSLKMPERKTIAGKALELLYKAPGLEELEKVEKIGEISRKAIDVAAGEIAGESPPTRIPLTNIPLSERTKSLIQLGKAGIGGIAASLPATPLETITASISIP